MLKPKALYSTLAIFVLLLLDLFGIYHFCMVALYYGMSFLVGSRVLRYIHKEIDCKPSLFSYLGNIALKTVLGISFLLPITFIAQSMGIQASWVLAIFGIVALVEGRACLLDKEPFQKIDVPLSHLTAVLIPFILIFLIAADDMVELNNSYLLRDPLHPILELSFASSLPVPFFQKPDFSFSGSSVHYHLFAPLQEFILIDVFKAEPLICLYRVLPLTQNLIYFALLAWIIWEMSTSTITVLFSLAAYLFGSPYLIDHGFRLGSNGSTILTFVASGVALSSIALLTFLIFCVLPRKKELDISSSLIGAPLALLSFFSKSPYIVPAFIVLGCWALFKALVKKKPQTLLFMFVCGTALLPFALLVGHGHSHNHWSLFPNYLQILRWTESYINLSESIPLQLAIYILSIAFKVLAKWGLLPLGLLLGYFFMPIRKENNTNSFPLRSLFVSAIFAFGISLVISEYTEGNHQYFYDAYIWLSWAGLLLFIQHFKTKKVFYQCSLIFLSLILTLNIGLNLQKSGKHKLINSTENLNFNPFLTQAKLFFQSTAFGNTKTSIEDMGLSKDAVSFYASLKDMEIEGVILSGLHYPNKFNFLGSAISQKPFLLEAVGYKSIITQTDFLPRAENIWYFYLRILNKNLTNYITPCIEYIDNRTSTEFALEYKKFSHLPIISKLELKGYPSTLSELTHYRNFLESLKHELTNENPFGQNAEKCKKILNLYNIGAVIFENGEVPDSSIASILNLKKTLSQGPFSLYQVTQAY
jgi:hypothetical protein